MSVLKLIAHISCEGCTRQFSVEVDTGEDIPEGWDLMEVVRDTVRGGRIDEVVGEKRFTGSCSVQNDKILCHVCTAEEDQREGGA